MRQVRAAAVDQIDARQAVLLRDLLGAQVLLDRHREVGAALHRGGVGDDHHLPARHPADAADDPRPRRLAVIEVAGGQLADLQEGRTRIQQTLDPLTRQQLAARRMALAGAFVAAQRGLGDLRAQIRHQGPVVRGVAGEGFAGRVDNGVQLRHDRRLAFSTQSRKCEFFGPLPRRFRAKTVLDHFGLAINNCAATLPRGQALRFTLASGAWKPR